MYWTTLVIVCGHLIVSCGGQSCTTSTRTSLSFQPLNVTYNGCNNTAVSTVVKPSYIDCSKHCLALHICVAFSYNQTSQLCRVCHDVSVSSLDLRPTMVSRDSYFGLRHAIQAPPTTATTLDMRLHICCGLSVGNLIVIRGVYTDISGFYISVHQDDTNAMFHFRARTQYSSNTAPYMLVNHLINNIWQTELGIPFNVFPFTLQDNFTVNILLKRDGFYIFVNGDFVYNFTYFNSPYNARYLYLNGTMQLLELSV